MEVIVGKLAGFCFGVQNAVDCAEKELDLNNNIYCLGEIVHNEQVIKNLEKKGMITVNNIDEVPDDSKVIFRAHGESQIIYEKAKQKHLEVIDLTCPKVKAIHMKVEREKDKSFIIIVGKKSHPEIIGTKGFAGENSFVIENEDEILDAYMEYEKTNLGRVYVVSQTTFSSSKFDKLSEEIQLNFCEADVIIDKTICNATENRQIETKEISKKVNKMIIIGGKHSSNTKELAKVSEENCGNVLLVQNVDDLQYKEIFNKSKIEVMTGGVQIIPDLKKELIDENYKIGIMAGASTPKQSIDEIIDFLKK